MHKDLSFPHANGLPRPGQECFTARSKMLAHGKKVSSPRFHVSQVAVPRSRASRLGVPPSCCRGGEESRPCNHNCISRKPRRVPACAKPLRRRQGRGASPLFMSFNKFCLNIPVLQERLKSSGAFGLCPPFHRSHPFHHRIQLPPHVRPPPKAVRMIKSPL
jgi:hypothetical protein